MQCWLAESFCNKLYQALQDGLTSSHSELSTWIARCCQIKADYVVADEQEKGLRALLNLGHTFAHALEACTHYRYWLHGEAVAIGLYCAALLSQCLGILDKAVVEQIAQMLKYADLPYRIPKTIDLQQLRAFMNRDKKIKNNCLRFVVIRNPGDCYLMKMYQKIVCIIHSLLLLKESKKMKNGSVQYDVGTVNQNRALFKPASWLTKVDFINHLILFNNILITVLAEIEGGKSSFSNVLLAHLDTQIKSIAMSIKPPCRRQEVIETIASQLHLNVDAHSDLSSLVQQINERKAHVLLVMDDAQHLPEEIIKEMLLAIKSQGHFGFFHLCLVSDYSVIATLNNLAADQFNNLVHTIELGPLNESETRTYVLQRAMTKCLINKPLSESQYKQFYQLTKGNLAKINHNLESFIIKCSRQKQYDKSVLLKKVGAALTCAAAIGFAYFYLNMHRTAFIAKPEPKVLPQKPLVTVEKAPEQLVSYIASWEDSSTIRLVEYAIPKNQPLDLVDEDNDNQPKAIVDKVVVIPTIPAKREPRLDAPLLVLPSQLVKIEFPKPIERARTAALKQAVQLLKKPQIANNKNAFTIQIAASHNIGDINRFKNSNKFLAQTKVRHFSNAKGTWYILTVGEFSSRNQALEQAKKLPAPFAKLNPWVRPLAGLANLG